jgi:hypothetical protein
MRSLYLNMVHGRENTDITIDGIQERPEFCIAAKKTW